MILAAKFNNDNWGWPMLKKCVGVIFFVVVFFAATVSWAESGRLEVTVNNIQKVEGTLMVAVFSNPEFWLSSDKPPAASAIKAVEAQGSLTVSVDALPYGTYSVSIFQDINENEELDTNFIGFPKEPFGFSAPMGTFGPPSFEDASLSVGEGVTKIAIDLN